MENSPKKRGFTSEPDPKYNTADWRGKKLRTAAYIRVSTDSFDQENSLKNQRLHYERMIPSNPLWEYAGIFQDEGISGTSMRNRKGLLRLIEECKTGNIDLIVVKEVSRLARNTRDCLDIAQQLSELNPPVGIFFENNNLNTLDTGSKIFLTVLAMCAELESELKSRSVEFGQNVLYGKYTFPVPTLLGYIKAGKYTMEIEPEGAKTVRLIYDLFLAGTSPIEIAAILSGLKRPTSKNNLIWLPSSVAGILSNEKYAGAYLMRKRFTVTFLTHQTRKNIGQKRIFHKPNHHEPIVSSEEHARALLMLRANHASPFFNNQYEIKIIRRGLLTGFIPMNVAFGGYGAEHYFAAYIMARVPEIKFIAEVPIIPGLRRINREIFCDRYTATLSITRTQIFFNTTCLSRINADYVEILLNPFERLLAIRQTTRRNRNAISWNSSTIPAKELNGVLFEMMDWKNSCQYKIPASVLRRKDETVLMFDLSNCEYRFRSGDKTTKYVRAIPSDWIDSVGIDTIDYMLRSRRAYAGSLADWRLSETAADVEGFDTYIEPHTNEKINSMIQELMENGK
jgi:DNA invertase Pin-like site-specific DNA recombinase